MCASQEQSRRLQRRFAAAGHPLARAPADIFHVSHGQQLAATDAVRRRRSSRWGLLVHAAGQTGQPPAGFPIAEVNSWQRAGRREAGRAAAAAAFSLRAPTGTAPPTRPISARPFLISPVAASLPPASHQRHLDLLLIFLVLASSLPSLPPSSPHQLPFHQFPLHSPLPPSPSPSLLLSIAHHAEVRQAWSPWPGYRQLRAEQAGAPEHP